MAFAKPSSKDLNQIPASSNLNNSTLTGPTNNIVARLSGVSSPFDAAAQPELGTSVIGTDLTILGDKITIISQNRLQIDGDIRGDVTGKQVTIGPEGSVTGLVSAEQIDVLGGVQGAIRARAVTLHPSSQVAAEIVHEKLSISEGAQFEGRVRRSKDVGELTPNLDPSSYAVSGSSSYDGSQHS